MPDHRGLRPSFARRAIVGYKNAISAIGLLSRSVVWQGKDAFSVAAPAAATDHFADRLRAKESAVMFIQDEGGIFPARGWEHSVLAKHRATYLRKRRLNRVCTWGERQQEALAAHGGVARDTIAVTGCPRFDLCSPGFAWIKDAAVTRALSQRRPYILMCTRFTSVVHFEGQDRVFRLRDKSEPQSVIDLRFATWQRDVEDFAEFVALTKEISAAYPDRDVIVRPHPSENAVFYQHAFAPFRNVDVTNSGSVLDWTRPAELVVHCNCTTGVEAVLTGQRALNMRPDATPRSDLDKEVAKEAGVNASSVRDALEKIEALLRAPAPPQVLSAQAKTILNNLKSDSIPMLADETWKVLREARIQSSRVMLPPSWSFRAAVGRWLRRPSAAGAAYIAARRGRLAADHVERVIDGYRSNHGGSGRLRHVAPDYVVVDPS